MPLGKRLRELVAAGEVAAGEGLAVHHPTHIQNRGMAVFPNLPPTVKAHLVKRRRRGKSPQSSSERSVNTTLATLKNASEIITTEDMIPFCLTETQQSLYIKTAL